MCLGQYISNTELLDLWQLCEIDEKLYNMGPLMFHGITNKSCGNDQTGTIEKLVKFHYNNPETNASKNNKW